MATGRIGTTPVLTTRWSKAPAAGTTSLSGLDDNSVSLVYSVGYEAVYQNGVLLSRGNDYTATNGTTITLTTATVAGDIIEVFANQTIPLTDTYSQTVANGKFINNTLTTTTGDIIYASAANTPARLAIGSTDQVLKVSGGIPAWGTVSSGAMTKIAGNTFTTQSSVAIDSVFSSTYRRYMAVLSVTSSVQNAVLQMQYRYAGPTTQAATYYGSFWRIDRNNATATAGYANVAQMTLDTHLNNTGGTQFPTTIWFSNVGSSTDAALMYGQGQTSIAQSATLFAGYVDTQRTYTGFLIKPDSGTITGSYAVYGLEN